MRPELPNMKYHANDWNIVTAHEKERERVEGRAFLSSPHFWGRCVEHYICNCDSIVDKTYYYNSIFHGRWFYATIMADNLKREIRIISHIEELHEKLRSLSPAQQSKGFVIMTNTIQKANGCCAGVVLSDGERELRAEILPDTVNTRALTDGSSEDKLIISVERNLLSLNYICGANSDYAKSSEYRFVLEELIRYCSRKKGYYEFVYGSDQIYKFPNLFFTYYSSNPRYGFNRGYLWTEFS